MGLLNIIHRMHKRQKLSIREIARLTGVSRNTVTKQLKFVPVPGQSCAIDGNQLTPKQIKAAAQNHELTEDFPERRFILAPEIGNGFEVSLQLTH